MEVRAFGLLLRDLVERVEPKADQSSPVVSEDNALSLIDITDLCLETSPEKRPNFLGLLKLMGGIAPLITL